jgi:FkbM family methyltransferase
LFSALSIISRSFGDRAAYFASHEKEFLEIQGFFHDDYSKNLWHKIREKFLYGVDDFSDIKTSEVTYLPNVLFASELSDQEIIVSAGVKDGEDTKNFCNFFGKRLAKLYAFEPIAISFEKSKENLYEYYEKKYPINLQKCGLSDKEQEIEFIFSEKELDGARIPNNMTTMQTSKEHFVNWQKEIVLVHPLDSIIPSNEKVTYIKMDIEGSETKALYGAKRIIQEHKPRLAICVYHNPKDYFEIPLLLKQFVPEYKFSLLHHHNARYDTVLYAAL